MAKEKREKKGEKQQAGGEAGQAHHSAKETPRLKEPLPEKEWRRR